MVPLVAVLVYLQHHAYDHNGFCICVLHLHYLHKCTRTFVLESSFTDACCICVGAHRALGKGLLHPCGSASGSKRLQAESCLNGKKPWLQLTLWLCS